MLRTIAPRVRLGLRARVRRGHDDAGDPVAAEGVGGDHRDQRRVDPARDRHEHAVEAVLADVVAQAEDERRVHLLEVRRAAPRRGPGAAEVDRRGAPRRTGPARATTLAAPRPSRSWRRRRPARPGRRRGCRRRTLRRSRGRGGRTSPHGRRACRGSTATPDGQTIRSAPASASSLAGGPGSQTSSQIVRPDAVVPAPRPRPARCRARSTGARRTRRSSAAAACGRRARPARREAARGRCAPPGARARRTHAGRPRQARGSAKPDQRRDAASPRPASSSSAAGIRLRKWRFRYRSSAGYPGRQSSGNSTSSAPSSRARAIHSEIRRAFSSTAPTVGLIWASARRRFGRSAHAGSMYRHLRIDSEGTS